ncbi:MAG: hypothetical protein OEX07_04880 [Gammaproteobacteria bacterium]|nr:hypothetical protein [Gammaproteobacteria bacterium]
MNLKLHHFFILTNPGGSAGDQLLAMGFKEAESRTHSGQGTVNRRFYMADGIMLELLWVGDVEESSNGPARDLRFQERSISDQASPFGLIFSPKNNDLQDAHTVPFAGWSYQPEYFSPPMAFHVGENSTMLNEPLCIYAPFFKPVGNESGKDRKGEKLERSKKVNEINGKTVTEIRITVPGGKFSPVLESAKETSGLTIQEGDRHLMEVFFELENIDDGVNNNVKDLRPDLPLVIYV